MGLSKIQAHAAMTTGARNATSWGSIDVVSLHENVRRFLGLVGFGRRAFLERENLARGKRAPLAASISSATA